MASSVLCANQDILQRTAELNNHAVGMLKLGDLQGSVNGFKGALQLAIALLDDVPCPRYDPGKVAPFVQHQQSGKTCCRTPHGCTNEVAQTSSQLCGAMYDVDINFSPGVSFDLQTREAFNAHLCEGTYMENAFVRAINLVPSNFAYSEDPLANLAVVSCIILFNIAVVSHRFAIVQEQAGCSDISHKHFRKAQALYFKAQSLLADAGISLAGSGGHAVIDLLNLAMYNNLGQSSFYLVDFPSSQEWFSLLLTYASTITAAVYDSNTADILEWHKTIFQLNAVSFLPPSTASAA